MKTPSIRTFVLSSLVGVLVGTVQPSPAAEPVVGVCSNAPATNLVVEMVKSPVVMKSLINSQNPFVYTVGTDTNGVPIQQVVWLYRKGDLKEQKCPIWAGSLVTLVREEDGAVRVLCDKTALPDEEQYHQFILKGNIVTGWLKKESVIKVKVSDWRENGKGTATSTPEAVFASLVSDVAALASHHAELAGFADYAGGRESELNISFCRNLNPVTTKRNVQPSDFGESGILLKFVLDDGSNPMQATANTVTYFPNLTRTLYADVVLWERASPRLTSTLEGIVAKHKEMLWELDKKKSKRVEKGE